MAGLKTLYFFGFFRAAFFVENQLGDALMPFQRCEPSLFFYKKMIPPGGLVPEYEIYYTVL